MEDRPTPIEAYSQLMSKLLADCDPAKAAGVVASYMPWRWEEPGPYDANAPLVLREMWSNAAWRRFEADNPVTRQIVAAHYLFRAASYEKGATRRLLMELGGSLLAEIVNTWLKDR